MPQRAIELDNEEKKPKKRQSGKSNWPHKPKKEVKKEVNDPSDAVTQTLLTTRLGMASSVYLDESDWKDDKDFDEGTVRVGELVRLATKSELRAKHKAGQIMQARQIMRKYICTGFDEPD